MTTRRILFVLLLCLACAMVSACGKDSWSRQERNAPADPNGNVPWDAGPRDNSYRSSPAQTPNERTRRRNDRRHNDSLWEKWFGD